MFKSATFILNNLIVDYNKEFLNVTAEVFNDGVNASVLNATIAISTVVEKVLLYLKVTLQENQNDEKYGKDFIRTVVDADKLLKGIYGNFIAKNLMENFFTSIDFDPKFPLQKVWSKRLNAKLLPINLPRIGNLQDNKPYNDWHVLSTIF